MYDLMFKMFENGCLNYKNFACKINIARNKRELSLEQAWWLQSELYIMLDMGFDKYIQKYDPDLREIDYLSL